MWTTAHRWPARRGDGSASTSRRLASARVSTACGGDGWPGASPLLFCAHRGPADGLCGPAGHLRVRPGLTAVGCTTSGPRLADPRWSGWGRETPEPQLKPVREQVVVVMGASSGIGRATAVRLAEEGAKVVVARGEAGLRSLVQEIRGEEG